ncbi:hypothetical protein C9374_011309 [Naegleria lovaniensis]|uniref:PH domain-containing protein n=1 Tax=Naegleria lovaniensis TaxID=51637 RepID=A0AA88H2R1_NAELO|nr:uncharacterized protein C9374_011309 [Naegleria lovaniensis]KAG2392584.1 hypothetical protein C9374_011309 [Naegleria lovaniensis]
MPSAKFLMDHQKYRKSGWLYKQGGSYRSVKKRFCILLANELFYFSKEDDEEHKGSIVLRGPVNRSSIAVEVKNLTLKNCIEIPSDKRTYLIWADSEYLAGEWAEALNDAYREFSSVSGSSSFKDPSSVMSSLNHSSYSSHRVNGGSGADEDNLDDDSVGVHHGMDMSDSFSLALERKPLTNKQLIESTIDQKDKFENTNYVFENNCCIHSSISCNVYTVDALQNTSSGNNIVNAVSKYLVTRKRQYGNKMTLDNAMNVAKSGDTLILKPGKHYIPSTLLMNRSLNLIGESDENNKCEIILLQDGTNDRQGPQPTICFNAPFSYCRNITFIHYRNDTINSKITLDPSSTTTTASQASIAKGRVEAHESVMSTNFILDNQSDATDNHSLFDCCWVTGTQTCVYFRKCTFLGGRNGLVSSINSSSTVDHECVFKDQKNHSIILTQQAKLQVKGNSTIYGNICTMHQSSAEIFATTIYSPNISALDESCLNLHHNIFHLPTIKLITFNQSSHLQQQQQMLKNKLVHNSFKSVQEDDQASSSLCKISIMGQSCPIIDDNQVTNKGETSLIYLFQTKQNMKNMLMKSPPSNTTILVASDFLN